MLQYLDKIVYEVLSKRKSNEKIPASLFVDVYSLFFQRPTEKKSGPERPIASSCA